MNRRALVIALATTGLVIATMVAVLASGALRSSDTGALECEHGFTSAPSPNGGVLLACASPATEVRAAVVTASPSTASSAPRQSAAPPPPSTAVRADAIGADAIGTTPATTPPPLGAQFVETFDEPSSLDRFRWELADGRPPWVAEGLTWAGDHDESCAGADTSRQLAGPAIPRGEAHRIPMYWDGVQGGVVYWCREHVMTSYNTEGYAHLDFSPTTTFTDVQRICWDMSASNLGGRKWTELSVVPVELFESNDDRLDYVNPTFAPDGPGGWGLAVEPGMAMMTINEGSIAGHGTLSGENHAVFLENTNKMDRLQTCINADGEVAQELADGSQRVTELEGTLPQGPVRIIWADVSYNPDKAVDESPATVGNPYTWHWDNIIVQ